MHTSPTLRRQPRATLSASLTFIAAALALACTQARADATLDKIKQRGKVTIGVLVNGGPFGSIDPSTQQLVGWNPELARALARAWAWRPSWSRCRPPRACSFCRPARWIC